MVSYRDAGQTHETNYVRTYHSVLWDNAAVLRDLSILAAE